jgi:hypothetical protein
MIVGCPRPKYFFSGLPNLLLQKIRLPLISFFFGVSYIWGSYIWGSSIGNGQWLEESSKHCPHRQTSPLLLLYIRLYVVWASHKGCHYVDLRLLFQGLAHGMPHTTSTRNTNGQMVLPTMYSIDLGTHFLT